MAGDQSQQIFPTAMRGYDKAQVDDRIRALESHLRDARARVEEVDGRAMKRETGVAERLLAFRPRD